MSELSWRKVGQDRRRETQGGVLAGHLEAPPGQSGEGGVVGVVWMVCTHVCTLQSQAPTLCVGHTPWPRVRGHLSKPPPVGKEHPQETRPQTLQHNTPQAGPQQPRQPALRWDGRTRASVARM